MKRTVVFLISCLLLLPAFANAWTLVVSNTNATPTQYVTITWANNPTGVKVAVNGNKSIAITTGQTATATYTLASGTVTPTLDGSSQGAKSNAGTVSVTPSTVRTLANPFSAVAATTYALGVTQTAGGVVTLKVGSATTTTGYSAIPSGTSYTVTATPNAGYKVASITSKTIANPQVTGVGVAASLTTTATVADTVSASFTAAPLITADLNLQATATNTQAAPYNTAIASVSAYSVPSSSLAYTWLITKPDTTTDATGTGATKSITVDQTGTYTVQVTVSATGATPVTKTGTFVASAGSSSANSLCFGCHTNSTPTIISDFNAGNHPNNVVGYDSSTLLCSQCHSAAPHANTSCIGCHSVVQNAGTAFVQDNAGVRAAATEFNKWSHHVTGTTLDDAHCAACHMEGKVDATGSFIVVDNTNHMIDNKVHLRNVDTDVAFLWNPESPDHSGMDNYCMSCHDSDGATSAESVKIQTYINSKGLAATGKTASATNPFGDTISNRYDKMERPAVVDAKGQFATGNASHHAVRGAKYTKRSRSAVGGARAFASDAAFVNNSSAVLYGARTTIYDAGKFESTYKTLSPVGGDYTLGDDSTLHCGDCHTVGQFAGRGSAAFGTMSTAWGGGITKFYKEAIGAHGSNNEYLLRNSIGTDERHVGLTYSVSPTSVNVTTNAGSPYLVCFNCHVATTYNSIGNATNTSGTNHAGEYANANRCNGPVNTISFAGYTTSVNDTAEPYAFRLGVDQPDYLNWPGASTKNGTLWSANTSDSDFSNAFGIQCANCHNAGPDNAFGGIHGSKVNVYTDANGSQQKPYRFLPGLGNTMFVPGSLGPKKNFASIQDAYSSSYGVGSVSDLNWEQKMLGTTYDGSTVSIGAMANGTVAGRTISSGGAAKTKVTDNSGCYTLVPESGEDGSSYGHAVYDLSPTFEQKNSAGQTLFGEWGGCDDHRGNASGKSFAQPPPNMDQTLPNYPTAVNTGGAGVTRKVLRPVTY